MTSSVSPKTHSSRVAPAVTSSTNVSSTTVSSTTTVSRVVSAASSSFKAPEMQDVPVVTSLSTSLDVPSVDVFHAPSRSISRSESFDSITTLTDDVFLSVRTSCVLPSDPVRPLTPATSLSSFESASSCDDDDESVLMTTPDDVAALSSSTNRLLVVGVVRSLCYQHGFGCSQFSCAHLHISSVHVHFSCTFSACVLMHRFS